MPQNRTLKELERIRVSQSSETKVPYPPVKVERDPVSRRLSETRTQTGPRRNLAPVKWFES